MALTWNRQAATMAPGAFTRSVGMRLAIVATTHLQARNLDHGLELGNRSVDILTRVLPAGPRTTWPNSTQPWPPGGATQPSVNSSTAPAQKAASPPETPPRPGGAPRQHNQAARIDQQRRLRTLGAFCPPARGARPHPRLLPAHRAG
jgi:hypothetical protein